MAQQLEKHSLVEWERRCRESLNLSRRRRDEEVVERASVMRDNLGLAVGVVCFLLIMVYFLVR